MNGEPSGGILRRAARNSGMLLGGKSAGGLMQLGTFALAARGLGVHDFGIFSVLVAQVMLLTGLAAFDSNQAIIRYGVPHLSADNRTGFQALIKAGTLLDVGAAAVAAIAAVALAPLVIGRMEWGPHVVLLAQMTAPLSFANALSTQKALLRLFDRYDLLSTHAIVTPLLRLIFIGGLWAAGATLGWYIAAWLVAGWAGAAVAFWFAWREVARRGLLAGMTPSLRRLTHGNAGVWRFSLISNLNSSVAMVPTHLSVLLVANLLGPAAAGMFRVAREMGTGMLKPVDLVNQALYPDMQRLVATRNWRRLTRTAVRAGLAAAATGAAVTLLIVVAGETIVSLIFGHAFVAVMPILILMGAGTSIRMLSFAADPVMYALGRPSAPLMISIASALMFIGIMLWRIPIDGLAGGGWAFVGMGVLGCALSGWAAWRMVRQERERTPA
jgi:O-antigen/teichoic acid export membrane protein